MLEEERKYQVDAGFTMPDLSDCPPSGGRVLPRPPVTLRATYYDTADRRLARAGVSLRHRRGEAPAKAWTLKLPSGTVGTRHEISRPGRPDAVPDELRWLVTAYARGAELAPAAIVRTVRRGYEIYDSEDRALAEIADDTVKVLDGKRVTLKFREIEVERLAGKPKLLDRVSAVLADAGARDGGFVPKHVRALGEAATRPPDLVPPEAAVPAGDAATAGDVITAALRRDIGQIFEYDPFVRLRDPLPDGDTPVHQMRVACRRLRGSLRTFSPLLAKAWTAELRVELSWLAGALGAGRDAEVLRARLRRTAAADPLAPLDAAAVDRLDARLAARQEAALTALDQVLRTERYLALLDALVAAAARPSLTKRADGPAVEVLPALVAKPWRRLVSGDAGLAGAGSLAETAPDAQWHEVRIRAKRARYAAEATADALGVGVSALGKALARVQTVLGEHQDAAIAADTWLELTGRDPADHALAVTAGRLVERERAAVWRARVRFGEVWPDVTRKQAVAWLT